MSRRPGVDPDDYNPGRVYSVPRLPSVEESLAEIVKLLRVLVDRQDTSR